jgi:hypothetical protein
MAQIAFLRSLGRWRSTLVRDGSNQRPLLPPRTAKLALQHTRTMTGRVGV